MRQYQELMATGWAYFISQHVNLGTEGFQFLFDGNIVVLRRDLEVDRLSRYALNRRGKIQQERFPSIIPT